MHRYRSMFYPLFLDPNPTPANGGAGTGYNPSISDEELNRKVQKILAKTEGGESEAVATLLKDNAEVREKNRQARTKITELEGKVPADGSVVLTGDEAKVILKLREDKVDIKKLPELVTENSTLKTKQAEIEAKELFNEAAKLENYDASMLSDLVNARKLHLEIKDVTVKENGKNVVKKVPHVRPIDKPNAALEPLTTFVENNAKGFLVALKRGSTTTEQVGEEFIEQSPSGKAPTEKNPVNDYLKATYGDLPFGDQKQTAASGK